MTVGEDLPEKIRQDLQHIASRCERENIPPNNLREHEFTPDGLQSKYDNAIEQLEACDGFSSMDAWNFFAENVDLDNTRESKYYLWDIAVTNKDGIVFEEYPSLRGLSCDDLKSIPEKTDVNKNGFAFENHYLIFCSRLAQNYYLTGKLGTLRSKTVDLSVPISYSRLGLPDTTRNTILAAHWRGPETIDELRARAGHKFFIQKATESYEHGIQDRTEFLFEKRGSEWHLQVEELLPRTGLFYSPHAQFRGEEINYYTRYLHAILGENCEKCFHMDGALRGYGTAQKFIDRHISKELTNSNSLKTMTSRNKLFKLDSQVGDITDFGEVAGLFFKHNPHVQRFFEGDSDYATEIEEKRAKWFDSDFKREETLSQFDV